MRNLKKVLSLSLAFVMLLGMMVMGSAATYNDAADVNYTEAVEVMSAAGIFNGDNGNFNPAGNLTREQAAKIITYMMMGKNAADKLNAGTAPYADVAADRWSAGSIAYCATMGITAGNGDGTFSPTANVTGYAFAKMLLTALGYDAKIQGYVNTADWAINVNKDALNAGLLRGLNGSLATNLTREQACQMAFNTMQADLVFHATKGTEINTGNMNIVVGASAPAKVEDATNLNKSNIDGTGDVLQFAERYCTDLELNALINVDDFGRPSNVWTFAKKPVGAYAIEPTFTYTADMAGAELKAKVVTKAMKGYTFAGNAAIVDGNTTLTTIDGVSDIVGLTGNGVLVEVYADRYNDIYAVAVTNTALVKIENIDAEKKTVDLSMLSGNTWTVAQVDEDNDCIDALLAMNERDYVLITALTSDDTNYEVASVAVPQSVTGLVTKVDTTPVAAVTVAGTAYNPAASEAAVSALGISNVNEQVLYLDAYGYGIFAEGVAATLSPDVIYVVEAYEGVNANGKVAPMVRGILADGTMINVEIPAFGTLKQADKSTPATDPTDAGKYLAYTYTINPLGQYVLTYAAGDGTDKGVAINGDSAPIIPDTKKNSTHGKFYTDDVKFIYADPVTGVPTVKTGIAIGTTLAAATNDFVVYSKDALGNVLVSAVFVKSAYAAPNADLIYVVSGVADPTLSNVGTKYGDDGKTTLYGNKVYLNGKETTIYTAAGQTTLSNTFYSYAIDEQTGAYKLTSYSNNVDGDAAVTKIDFVNGRYYIDSDMSTPVTDLFDATDATVVDATGVLTSNINTMAKLAKADADGTVTVALVCDAQAKTVNMVYVLTNTPD